MDTLDEVIEALVKIKEKYGGHLNVYVNKGNRGPLTRSVDVFLDSYDDAENVAVIIE